MGDRPSRREQSQRLVETQLQRLDGPCAERQDIQELEADFRGAGWNVIKVIWGAAGTDCWPRTPTGAGQGDDDCVDGDYQNFKSRDGAFVREHFFGATPVCSSGSRTCPTRRSGAEPRWHDQQKVYAAYDARSKHTGQPTVILAKTIKGYGMGVSGEGQMITHQAKKMTEARCWPSETASSCP